MRLIDADKLKELRHQYIQGRIKFDGNEYDLIDKCPTIDAVEVIRCKDCKHQEACTRLVTEVIYDPVLKENVCYHCQMEYCSNGEPRSHHDSLCDQTEEGA